MTEAVLNALRERLARQQKRRPPARTARDVLREARLRLSRLPVLDNRSADEILGYDETDARYALAKATGEPPLYKGEDFSQTDIAAGR